MKLRHKYSLNINYKNKIIISALFVILITIYYLKVYSNRSLIYLNNYASSESTEIATMIINKAIKEEINNNIKEITITSKNSNNEIINIEYDMNKLNILLSNITDNMLNSISIIESGNINKLNLNYYNNQNLIYYVPLGVIYDIPILTDISPKIPFKVSFLGSTECNLNSNIKEYGINNSLLEVFISVVLNVKVIFPFTSKDLIISKNILLSSNIIQGSIPNYYGGIITNSSPIYSK